MVRLILPGPAVHQLAKGLRVLQWNNPVVKLALEAFRKNCKLLASLCKLIRLVTSPETLKLQALGIVTLRLLKALLQPQSLIIGRSVAL